MKKHRFDWKVLVVSIIIVYAFAFVGSIFTSQNVNSSWYQAIKPSITPPGWVFPIVWNILFFLIAISIYFAWMFSKKKSSREDVILFFGSNLFFNVLWSYLFFSTRNPVAAFVDLIILWFSILLLIKLTWKMDKKSAWLLVPYLVWVTFAGILNGLIVL